MATHRLPWQNTIQISTEQNECRATKRFQQFGPAARNKATSSVIPPSRSTLNPEEMNRAQALANTTTNYQRPDPDLIEAMKKRQQKIVISTTQDIQCIESSPLSPLVPDENLTLAKDIPPTPDPHRSFSSVFLKLSKKSFNWEEKAIQTIEREQLSLDREWSRLSWKQKASNIVRLKLLKDDGYDISPLMAKGITADQIIDALLAYVEARKQRSLVRNTSGSDRESKPDLSIGTNTSSMEICSSITHEFSTENSDFTSRSSPVQSLAPLHSKLHVYPSEGPLRTTLRIIGQKRKHTHKDELQPSQHETQPQANLQILDSESIGTAQLEEPLCTTLPKEPLCTCGLPPKIARLLPPTDIAREIHEQAYSLLKWRISRSLFHSSRIARTASYTYSATTATGDTLSVPKLIATPRTPPKPSRILFTQHTFPGTQPSGSHVYITSRAFDLIKREIQCLSWSYDNASNSYCIRNHDASDVDEHSFQHNIRMSVLGDESTVVIESEPLVLMALMRYLRENELFHLGKWAVGDVRVDEEGERDVQMRVVVNEAPSMQLSHRTDRVLEEVESRLGERKEEGGDEVRVGVVRQCGIVRDTWEN